MLTKTLHNVSAHMIFDNVSLNALAENAIYGPITLSLFVLALAITGFVRNLLQARKYNAFDIEMEEVEEEIACVGLESISAEEYLDMEELEFAQAQTAHVEIRDNVVYLDAAYVAEEDVVVMTSAITTTERVETTIWSARRTYRKAVKFAKDLAGAPARIAKLEAEVAELRKINEARNTEIREAYDLYLQDKAAS